MEKDKLEQTHQIQKKRPRINWKDNNVTKTFLEACIHEVSANGREGCGLKGLSWTRVGETLKTTHNFIVDKLQMKNRLDYLKGKYQAFVKLKNRTGNVYDPLTNTFNLSPEEWEIEMKSNKYVEKLRTASLAYPDLCAKLFDGAVAKGIEGWGPAASQPMPSVMSSEAPVMIDDDIEKDVHESTKNNDFDVHESTKDSDIQETSQGCSSRPKAKKSKVKESQAVIDSEILDVLKIMSGKTRAPNKPPSFDECLSVLDSLGWESDDSLYDIALAIISDEKGNYREAWMKLKPERRENWVRMIDRKERMMYVLH